MDVNQCFRKKSRFKCDKLTRNVCFSLLFQIKLSRITVISNTVSKLSALKLFHAFGQI